MGWRAATRTTAADLDDGAAVLVEQVHLVDDEQGWVERDDVKIWYLGRTGGLKPGFGADESKIGPELGFGCVVGEAFEEPVLLIKIAWGGTALLSDGAVFVTPRGRRALFCFVKSVVFSAEVDFQL